MLFMHVQVHRKIKWSNCSIIRITQQRRTYQYVEAQSREQLHGRHNRNGLKGCKLTRVLKGELSFASGEEGGVPVMDLAWVKGPGR